VILAGLELIPQFLRVVNDLICWAGKKVVALGGNVVYGRKSKRRGVLLAVLLVFNYDLVWEMDLDQSVSTPLFNGGETSSIFGPSPTAQARRFFSVLTEHRAAARLVTAGRR
jgi:hypothetical protein